MKIKVLNFLILNDPSKNGSKLKFFPSYCVISRGKAVNRNNHKQINKEGMTLGGCPGTLSLLKGYVELNSAHTQIIC